MWVRDGRCDTAYVLSDMRNTAQHPLSGGKKEEYDVGVTATTLALRG